MRKLRSKLVTGAAIGGAAVGGAALANAATSSSSTSSSSATASTSTHSARSFNGPAPGTPAHEDAEKTVTGSAAAKARAAAVKAVGSGTAGEVTTDFTGSGYETTVTKSDGSKVEVHLDNSFRVMEGRGGHDGHRGADGPGGSGDPAGQAPPGAPG